MAKTKDIKIINEVLNVRVHPEPLPIYKEGSEPEPSGDPVFEFDYVAQSNFPYLYLPCQPVTSVEVQWMEGVVTTETTLNAQSPQLLIANGTKIHVKITGAINRIYLGNDSSGLDLLYPLGGNHEALLSIQQGFQNTTRITVETLPYNLLWNARNLENFQDAFVRCTELTEIPSGLLQFSTKALNFQRSFGGCPKLTGIPSSLFANCPLIVNFHTTFYQNSGLGSIPKNIFDNNKMVETFQECFYGCNNILGTTPTTDGLELWERAGQPGYPATINGTNCFYGCEQLSNYEDIPVLWGGPATRAALQALKTDELECLLTSYIGIKENLSMSIQRSVLRKESDIDNRILLTKQIIEENSLK